MRKTCEVTQPYPHCCFAGVTELVGDQLRRQIGFIENACDRPAEHVTGDPRIAGRVERLPMAEVQAPGRTSTSVADRVTRRRSVTDRPRPALLQSMAMMWSFRREWRLTSPPYPVALPLCATLSVPARLLGYRA